MLCFFLASLRDPRSRTCPLTGRDCVGGWWECCSCSCQHGNIFFLQTFVGCVDPRAPRTSRCTIHVSARGASNSSTKTGEQPLAGWFSPLHRKNFSLLCVVTVFFQSLNVTFSCYTHRYRVRKRHIKVLSVKEFSKYLVLVHMSVDLFMQNMSHIQKCDRTLKKKGGKL